MKSPTNNLSQTTVWVIIYCILLFYPHIFFLSMNWKISVYAPLYCGFLMFSKQFKLSNGEFEWKITKLLSYVLNFMAHLVMGFWWFQAFRSDLYPFILTLWDPLQMVKSAYFVPDYCKRRLACNNCLSLRNSWNNLPENI